MAATNIIVGFDVAIVTDAGGTVVLGGTPLRTDTGITIVPVAAHADGLAQVWAYGFGLLKGAAQMDGHAQMSATNLVVAAGAVEMDGQAQVSVGSLATSRGAAGMDGLAQVFAASAPMATGAAQMDGRASTVVAQSVHGAGLTEMDGAASMVAVGPNIYRVNLIDGFTSRDGGFVYSTYNRTVLENFISRDTTKPSVRYLLTSQEAIKQTDTIINRMKFLKVLREVAITLTPSLPTHTHYNYAFSTLISVRPTLIPDWRVFLSLVQNLTVHPTTSLKFIWGRILRDALKVSATVNASGVYKKVLAQLFRFSDVDGLRHTIPIALSQGISLSLSLAHTVSLKLLQQFLVATASSPVFTYHVALAGRVVVRDILDHFARAIISQLFTVHPAVNRQYVANSSLAQLLTVSPALTNKLVLEIVESSNLVLDSSQLVRMIYKGDPLLDAVEITALYISPSGTTTTWAVNTRTNAVTEYLNYAFRSFAWMDNRYIAAGSDGLYELDGDTDDGASIIAEMMSGYLQLNEKKLFGIKGAYVAIRGGGRFYLKLISGDGREYVYELRAQPNLMTTKVKVGKGLRTTYMAFDLVTEGQDFDLDSIEFIPMTSGRRV